MPSFDLGDYCLSEPQAIAILAALKQLQPQQVADLSQETRNNLSMAYHRLTDRLTRNLKASPRHTNAIL